MTTSNPAGTTPPPSTTRRKHRLFLWEQSRTVSNSVWNTLVGDVGEDAAAQAVMNTRALNAGTAAINSGPASPVTVTPAGQVTTVTPSGDKNTGQATATDTV